MDRNCSRQNKGISGNLTEGTAELCTRERKINQNWDHIFISYLSHGEMDKRKKRKPKMISVLLSLEGLLMNILTIDHYLSYSEVRE